RWAPKGIISRAESWVLEESEVDPLGQTLRCTTKNLEFTKVMKMEESVFIRQTEDGYVSQVPNLFSVNSFCLRKTVQPTEARVLSGFGWGLTKRIESHGLNRFKAHVHRVRRVYIGCITLLIITILQSREGVSLILKLLRESRLQP
ncbi:hypothetical protein ISU91_21110, partial [Leptospira borgpetersenii serovar Hardjo-bovis]|nr:hypothetical protein [Leptospira borgpetersenii serovar Hardjo-bovis]